MSLKVDVRKLDLFNQIAKVGSQQVADSLTQMTGLDAGIELSKINFLHMEDVKTHLGNTKRVGIFVELTESPYGYVLFMLDPGDSKRLAGHMVPGDGSDGAGFSDMERSAIQEIGNIMTSGYIDGWANVLQTTIDMSTPSFVYGPSSEVIEKMGGWPDQDMVFVLDSQITAAGTDVDLTVYTFPELQPLVDLIGDIEVDTDVQADTQADRDVAPGS